MGISRPIGGRAQALLRQEVEINIDHGTSQSRFDTPTVRVPCGLPAGQTCGN